MSNRNSNLENAEKSFGSHSVRGKDIQKNKAAS